MLASNIPLRFLTPFAKNAIPGTTIRTVPQASQIGVQNGAASYNDGFPPLTMIPIPSGGVPPFGQDMNGVLFDISSWSQWYQAGGPVGYDATFSAANNGYPAGAVLSANGLHGQFWYSLVDNNTTNPDAGGSNWVGFTPLTLFAVDSGTADAGVATLIPAPTSLNALLGMAIRIQKIGSPNTGAYTLNLNTFGATPVAHPDGTPLSGGELPAGGVYTVVYDGTQLQLQSAGSALGVTPTQLQEQEGNYAIDTGTANAMVITLSPVPASWASLIGAPIRIRKSGAASTAGVVLNVNGLGNKTVQHADGSGMGVGELPANGLIEVAYDGANVILLSNPLAIGVAATAGQMEAGVVNNQYASPANLPYSPWAIKGWAFFHWNGSSIITTDKSSTVQSISRSGVGIYAIQLQGGLAYVNGFAMANGGGNSPAFPGTIGMGARFSGTDPSVTVRFGDAGGSGGELSDPSDACVLIFGKTNN